MGQYHLSPGRKLGRHYKILNFIGEGWEGEVYTVEEVGTGIVRAAKLFYKHCYLSKEPPHIEHAKKLYRLRKSMTVTQFHHQDTIELKGESVDFLVSEFVDGDVLSHYIEQQKQERLQPFEALHLFYAVVQGVEKIHLLGEYHGDIHSENIIIRRKGLGFEVSFIDLLHLGKSSKAKIQVDVYDLITLLYEMIGGMKYYSKMPIQLKKIICGCKRTLIRKKFKNASDLRLYLESLQWG